MIESSELRIGNFFLDENGNIQKLHCINVLHDLVYYPNETPQKQHGVLYRVVTYMDANPIPLTEEWLERFEFETDKITFWKEYTGEDNAIFYVHIGFYKSGFYYLPDSSIKIRGIKIEFVHQLQNLYFALTGKELEYK